MRAHEEHNTERYLFEDGVLKKNVDCFFVAFNSWPVGYMSNRQSSEVVVCPAMSAWKEVGYFELEDCAEVGDLDSTDYERDATFLASRLEEKFGVMVRWEQVGNRAFTFLACRVVAP